MKENYYPSRPAWVEIDLTQLRKNFETFATDRPANLAFTCIVKDDAYGHGMVEIAKIAAQFECTFLGVVTVDEGAELRKNGLPKPILLLGERTDDELDFCAENELTCCVNDLRKAEILQTLGKIHGRTIPIHIEIDTGMSRYGIRWTDAMPLIEELSQMPELELEGVMTHFAMSDELDKSFAMKQLNRFKNVLSQMKKKNIHVRYTHACNTGGYLDLPMAHFDMVRVGTLPLGVYPSKVCRRIPGLKPVMTVKTQIAAIRDLLAGDKVGYGMHYEAVSPRKIAVLPIGYGDGYPRVRNKGQVLIHGKYAQVVGGNAMDAMMVDITDIPEADLWDDVVLLGRQRDNEITARDLADLKGSVTYDSMICWRSRLPRVYLNRNSK